ncbi:MAG: MATE family efflux transporter, partial [Alphaproteobacteria bacterium]|nr:MATE family efflux transporter [Alphaproteobacteria bacterium]
MPPHEDVEIAGDMTPAYKDAWRLAWPLILSNVTVPLLGMVDTAVVGHLPEPHHLGAVALGASSFSALFYTVISLRMGTTGLIAQAFGARDRFALQAGFFRALGLALLIAVLMILMTGPIIAAAGWIFAPTERVGEGMAVYLQIRLLAAPAALANMVILGWLLGVQDAKSPLYLLLLGNGLNMILDVVFVFGLGFEVSGVAWATVIAEYATLLAGGWFVRRRFGPLSPGLSFRVLLDRVAARRLAAVNGDIVLRSLVMQIAFVSLVALGSRQGEAILAANTVLTNMLHLSAFALDGFAFAASTLVGRHIGAGDRRAMRAAVHAALVWSLVFALVITLAFALGGGLLVRLITNIDAVRETAMIYLPYAVAGPAIGAIAFAFDGIYVGATRTREMRNGMVGAVLAFGASAWLLVPPFGNHGLWLAYHAFMITRAVWLSSV